jgi:hypothetical protein
MSFSADVNELFPVYGGYQDPGLCFKAFPVVNQNHGHKIPRMAIWCSSTIQAFKEYHTSSLKIPNHLPTVSMDSGLWYIPR